MSIESLLKKLKDSGMDEEALKGIIEDIQNIVPEDSSSDKEAQLREQKATNKRILEEKKAQQAKVAELEAQLEEIKTSDLSEQEKLQRQLEKTLNENSEFKLQIEAKEGELKSAKREWALTNISKGFNFISGIPDYLQEAAIQTAFKDIEDLNDTEAIKSATEAFKECNKGILAAEVVGGANTHNKSDQTSKPTGEPSLAQRAKELASLNNTI